MTNDEQSLARQAADPALLWYEKQAWLRALVQVVPVAGGSLDTLLAWRAVHLNNQRIERLFTAISERLEKIEAGKLDEQFIQSEEFFELFRTCTETVVRTASSQKRQLVADFLAGTIQRGVVTELSQQIAEDIQVLQDLHLQILADLAIEPIAEVNSYPSRRLQEMPEAVYQKGIADLERLGFLNYTNAAIVGPSRIMRTTGYFMLFTQAVAGITE
jgi:hypothetical protein